VRKDELIREAMTELEGYPSGGIGLAGPTLKELDECVQVNGRSYADDAGYHVVQWAWRTLEKALEAK
jgi:hypothetical protein